MFPKPVVASEPARASLVRQALRLEWITAGWMLIEAAVAIGSGAAAHSLSLIAYGVDSLIELASAGVLLWRLDVEMRRGEEFPERVERRASRIGAVLLFGLATYVVMSAAYGFWVRRGQEFSTPGFAIAVLAIPVMWWLANAKIRIADQIGSRQQAYLRIARFFAGLRAKAEQLDAVQRRYRILSEAPRKYLHGRQLIPPARVVLALDRPPTARKLADDHDEVAGDTPVR